MQLQFFLIFFCKTAFFGLFFLLSHIFFVYLHHISTKIFNLTKMKKQVFTVEGMKCVHCEAKVEAALKALDGVKEVKADHDADNVTIEYDEASVQPEQMKEAVDDLGRFEMVLN